MRMAGKIRVLLIIALLLFCISFASAAEETPPTQEEIDAATNANESRILQAVANEPGFFKTCPATLLGAAGLGVFIAALVPGGPLIKAAVTAAVLGIIATLLQTCYYPAENFEIGMKIEFSSPNKAYTPPDGFVVDPGQPEPKKYNYAAPVGAILSVSDIGTYTMKSHLCINSKEYLGHVWLEVDGRAVKGNPLAATEFSKRVVSESTGPCLIGGSGRPNVAYKGLTDSFNYRFLVPGPHTVKVRYCSNYHCDTVADAADWKVLIVNWDYNAHVIDPKMGFVKGVELPAEGQKPHAFAWSIGNETDNTLQLVAAEASCPPEYFTGCHFLAIDELAAEGKPLEILPRSIRNDILMVAGVTSPSTSPKISQITGLFTFKDKFGFKQVKGAYSVQTGNVEVKADVVQAAVSPYKKSGTLFLNSGTYYMQVCRGMPCDAILEQEGLILRDSYNGELLGAVYFTGPLATAASQDINCFNFNKTIAFNRGPESTTTFTIPSPKTIIWEYSGIVGGEGLQYDYNSDFARIGTAINTGTTDEGFITADILDVNLGDKGYIGAQKAALSAESYPLSETTVTVADGEVSLGSFGGKAFSTSFLPFPSSETLPDGSVIVAEGKKLLMLKGIILPNDSEDGPVSRFNDGFTTVYILNIGDEPSGDVYAYTDYFTGTSDETAGITQDIALLWQWREKYLLKISGETENLCIGKNNKIGYSGPEVRPKIKYSWSWAEDGIGIDSCDSTNPNYIYCDSTQFTIMALKRLKKITELAASEESIIANAAEIERLSSFNAYLMYDGFSDDFRADFDNYAKNSDPYISTPTWYAADLWDKYITDLTRMQFEVSGSAGKALPKSGLYKVDFIFDFSHPSNLYKFSHSGSIDAKVKIMFGLVNGAAYDNPLYYLPIDSVVGFNSAANKFGRNGYGVSYLGEPTSESITITGEGANLITPLPSDAANALVLLEVNKILDFDYVQFDHPGVVFNLYRTNDPSNPKLAYRLDYSPNYATPVLGKIEKSAEDPRFAGLFYTLTAPDAKLVSKAHLNSWTAFGESIEEYACRDYNDKPLFTEIGDLSTTNNSGFCFFTDCPAYGFGFNINESMNGSIYAATAFFTPVGSAGGKDYILKNVGRQGKLYSVYPVQEISKGSFIPLNANAESVASLQDTITAIENRNLCMNWSDTTGGARPESMSLFWNYGKLVDESISSLPEDSSMQKCI